MRSILFIIIIFFCCVGHLSAQSSNPFDLKNRKKQSTDQQQTTSVPISNNVLDTNDRDQTAIPGTELSVTTQSKQPGGNKPGDTNPFDLNRNNNSTAENPTIAAVDPNATVSPANPFDVRQQGETSPSATTEIESTDETNNNGASPIVIRKKAGKQEGQQQTFLFWTILGLLFTGTLVFVLFQPFINKSYRAFTNDNMLKLLQRENAGSVTFPYLILYTFFFINAGVFTYLASTHFGFVRENYGSFLLKAIFGIAVFFFVKHLLLSFIASTFQVHKETEQYTFTILVFSIILGIVLVPFNVLTAFSTPTVSQIAFYGAFVMIGVIYLFRLFRSLFIASKFITLNKFHFFMYLCTIEIAPIAILIKVLMNSTGVQ